MVKLKCAIFQGLRWIEFESLIVRLHGLFPRRIGMQLTVEGHRKKINYERTKLKLFKVKELKYIVE